MDLENSLQDDLDKLEGYIDYLEKQKVQLERKNLEKRKIIEQLKKEIISKKCLIDGLNKNSE